MTKAKDVIRQIDEAAGGSSKTEVTEYLDQANQWITKAENVLFSDKANSGDLVKKLRKIKVDLKVILNKVK